MSKTFRAVVFSALAIAAGTRPAAAWWDEGHMQIAAVAYDRLTPEIRAKADALIKLNPEYDRWVAGVPESLKAQYAFIKAATWADDIKGLIEGYTNNGDKATNPQAGRNVGYYDHYSHGYWHFKDIGFSTDGTPVEDADPVNALTQIKVLSQGLSSSSGLADDVRSYDLVWLIHLVGDAHQPLHATARFSQAHKHGDQGGNLDEVVTATGAKMKLHAYWDGLFGGYSTPYGAIFDGLVNADTRLPEPDTTLAAEHDPEKWFQESQKLAIDVAYAEPVRSGPAPYMLDRTYETNALTTGRNQAALAAARLANLITVALK
ncbi:S1/P1 nuclease [Rhizobium sp. SG741]|uniref:S1/P1 nuclease n=1 Tax=Rhizobium sp. SG741 TaxID=2587114 RepID=UPI0014464FE5|nr:S1/P1 nuclease [Rhizobium sp. SG741]